MSGRPPCVVWNFFDERLHESGRIVYACRYCRKQYSRNNAKIKRNHISRCKKAPVDVKNQMRVFMKSLNKKETSNKDDLPLDAYFPTKNNSGDNKRERGCDLMTIVRRITNNKIREKFVNAAIVSGLDLSCFPAWNEFFETNISDFTVPTDDVFGVELDKLFKNCFQNFQRQMVPAENVNVHLCSCFDVKKFEREFVNVLVSGSKKQKLFFNGFVDLDYQNDEHVADEMDKIVKKIGEKKIFAFVGDREEPKIENAFKKLQIRHPSFEFLPCVARSLFSIYRMLIADESVSSFVLESTIRLKTAMLVRWVERSKCMEIEQFFCDKPWNFECLITKTLRFNKTLLNKKTSNLDDLWWTRVDEILSVLEPVVDTITVVKNEKFKISNVLGHLNDLQSKVSNALNRTTEIVISEREKTTLKEKIAKKIKEIIQPIHLAAAFLDLDSNVILKEDELPVAIEYVRKISNSLDIDDAIFDRDLFFYSQRTKMYGFSFESLTANSIDRIAERILNAPSVCVPSGNEFETRSYIRQIGNNLPLNKLRKAIFVAYNSKLGRKG